MCKLCKDTRNRTGINQETGVPHRILCECQQLATLQAQYDRLQAAIEAAPPADRAGLYWASGYIVEEMRYLQAVLQ